MVARRRYAGPSPTRTASPPLVPAVATLRPAPAKACRVEPHGGWLQGREDVAGDARFTIIYPTSIRRAMPDKRRTLQAAEVLPQAKQRPPTILGSTCRQSSGLVGMPWINTKGAPSPCSCQRMLTPLTVADAGRMRALNQRRILRSRRQVISISAPRERLVEPRRAKEQSRWRAQMLPASVAPVTVACVDVTRRLNVLRVPAPHSADRTGSLRRRRCGFAPLRVLKLEFLAADHLQCLLDRRPITPEGAVIGEADDACRVDYDCAGTVDVFGVRTAKAIGSTP